MAYGVDGALLVADFRIEYLQALQALLDILAVGVQLALLLFDLLL